MLDNCRSIITKKDTIKCDATSQSAKETRSKRGRGRGQTKLGKRGNNYRGFIKHGVRSTLPAMLNNAGVSCSGSYLKL